MFVGVTYSSHQLKLMTVLNHTTRNCVSKRSGCTAASIGKKALNYRRKKAAIYDLHLHVLNLLWVILHSGSAWMPIQSCDGNQYHMEFD